MLARDHDRWLLTEINAVLPNYFSFFENVHAVLQEEPAGFLGPEISGQLAAIGIEKRKPFPSDARMKKILVLGAGMVAGPLVRYLLESGYSLTVTSLVLEDAVKLVGGDPQGTALRLDLSDQSALSRLIGDHDLVVSLVPYSYHPLVANHCLESGRHLITASYVSDEMAALDGEARAADLTFLNEMGLDARRLPRAGSKDIGDISIRTKFFDLVGECKNVRNAWAAMKKGDWRKGQVAGIIRRRALADNGWLAKRLHMGARNTASRTMMPAAARL